MSGALNEQRRKEASEVGLVDQGRALYESLRILEAMEGKDEELKKFSHKPFH